MSVSSSNLVKLSVIKETTYGETPAVGDFKTARFTSESLSGTPGTVESKQIRTDRMSSGQIVTSLEVGGNNAFELAKEANLEDYMESVMYSAWQVHTLVTVDLEVDTVAKEIIRSSGSWISNGIVKGDIVKLDGFVSAFNNVNIMVTQVVSATVIKFVGPFGMVDEVGPTGLTTYKRADKLTIGTDKTSFSMQKEFTDLTDKAINYRGMIAASMDLNVAYGDIITGSFGFSGNDYEVVDVAADFITDGRTVTAPATTDSMNGSVDMPFLASEAIGIFDESDFLIKSIALKLDNNLTAVTAIGNIAPRDYSPGTAKIDIDLSAYLSDSSWQVLGKKLTQESFAIGFMVKNFGGFYGFYIPAIQVSFDDPVSGGQNQDILLAMKGTAKVDTGGLSALVIYRGT